MSETTKKETYILSIHSQCSLFLSMVSLIEVGEAKVRSDMATFTAELSTTACAKASGPTILLHRSCIALLIAHKQHQDSLGSHDHKDHHIVDLQTAASAKSRPCWRKNFLATVSDILCRNLSIVHRCWWVVSDHFFLILNVWRGLDGIVDFLLSVLR